MQCNMVCSYKSCYMITSPIYVRIDSAMLDYLYILLIGIEYVAVISLIGQYVLKSM